MKNLDYLGLPLTDHAYSSLKPLSQEKPHGEFVFTDADNKPVYDRKVQRAFKKALVEAEISNFHFHDLRQREVILRRLASVFGKLPKYSGIKT